MIDLWQQGSRPSPSSREINYHPFRTRPRDPILGLTVFTLVGSRLVLVP